MKYLFIIFLLSHAIFQCNRHMSEKTFYSKYQTWDPPKLITKGKLIYPDSLKNAKITGTIFVECVVDTQGTVIEMKIFKSSNKRLNKFALETVSNYKFLPGRLGKTKVRTKIVVPIKFNNY